MAPNNQAPFKLVVEERSLPVPTNGSPPLTIDWLPDFLGYSWVAFSSHTSLVISITSHPTRGDEADAGICQIIDTLHDAPTTPITCVRWAPTLASPHGMLAASAQQFVWMYRPEFSDADAFSGFPEGWVLSHKLEHDFPVWSFAWTESGDGLLCVGTEVVMWTQKDTGWCHLWTSPVTHPQSLAAATLSARGLAATAEGGLLMNSVQGGIGKADERKEVPKGRANIWWWEDTLGLLNSELVHPQEVLMVQWRPSKGCCPPSDRAFRPVLVTACKDGAVRLWLEIDSGRARLDKALGKDVPLKHLKPAYFVSAVIEAEQCLHGTLGVDTFLSWALESRPKHPANLSMQGVNTITKRRGIESCEWLVGLGPEGSVCLWAVFCLDDIHPPRCPRIFLWKQTTQLLTLPDGSRTTEALIKVVSQRLGKGPADPPSSLDLFTYVSQSTAFKWSRIWPPVSALSGDPPKEGIVMSEAIASGSVLAADKKEAWGVVSSCANVNGHSCDIISLAIHPISFAGLLATLDSQGEVFIWRASSFGHKVPSHCVPVWKPSAHLTGPKSHVGTLIWLPAVLPQDKTILLLAHLGFVDCYLISRSAKDTLMDSFLEIKLLSTFDLCIDSPKQGLKGIGVLPMNIGRAQNCVFTIIGIGQARGEVVSCNLELEADDQADVVINATSVKKLDELDSVSSIAFVPGCFLPYEKAQAEYPMFEPLVHSRPYDLVTGSTDGILRLWKHGAGVYSAEAQDAQDDVLQCVGILKVSSGPVTVIAIGSFGLKIATWSPTPLESYGEGILLWDIESFHDGAAFSLNGRILSEGHPVGVQWHELGNGSLMLGLFTTAEVQVYAQPCCGFSREGIARAEWESIECLVWPLLASAPLFSTALCFSWGARGSLIIPFREQLLVYGPWIVPHKVGTTFSQENFECLLDPQRAQGWTLMTAGEVLNSSLSMHHPVTMLYDLLTGNYQRARVCLLHLQQNAARLSSYRDVRSPHGVGETCTLSQLLEALHTEEKSEKKTNIGQLNSMSWSAGFSRDYEIDAAGFSKMDLGDVEGSLALNMEKIELCLVDYSHMVGLTEDQKMQLLTVADVVVKLDKGSKISKFSSLDIPGQRFWMAVQLALSAQGRKTGLTAHVEDVHLESKAMAWALQSDCKDTLLEACYEDELSWPSMQALGVGFWQTDISQLRAKMEKLARVQYLKEKNPKHCALLYLALQRKNVLMGLFKLSKDEKDKVLYEFLARNFQEEKNQSAALKNAYVLMGKHQHDLAAAFFLLGGDLSSAVSVCAKNIGDLQLALVVCRLVEGANGTVAQRLIKEYALPKARSGGDYWLVSLCQWLVGEWFPAIEELIGRWTFSEAILGSGDLEKEDHPCVVLSERTGIPFADPEVGQFCLHVTSKPALQSRLSARSAVTLRQWIICKTSAALERLGLPLQALEFLRSVGNTKQSVPNYNSGILSSGEHSLKSLPESFGLDLEEQSINVVLPAVECFTALKIRLALQFQAHLAQAHPCWWSRLSSPPNAMDAIQHPFVEAAAKASDKMIESVNVLKTRFALNKKYVAAELARLAYHQNLLYVQCLLFGEFAHESKSRKETVLTPYSSHFLEKAGADVLRIIVIMGIQGFKSSMKASGRTCYDVPKLVLVSFDLWLLLSQHHTESRNGVVGAVLLLITSYSVAAWRESHWKAISFVTRLIKSFTGTLSALLSDMEAAFGILLKTSNDAGSSGTPCMLMSEVSSDLSRLTEDEVWHVLSLAFWEALLGWAKKLLGHVPPTSSCQVSAEMSVLDVPRDDGIYNDCVKVVSSLSSAFQRKLVTYVNSSTRALLLRHWLWGQSKVTNLPLKLSSGPASSGSSFSSTIDSPLEELWKELVLPNSIRLALDLGGAGVDNGGVHSSECLNAHNGLGMNRLEKGVGFSIPDRNNEDVAKPSSCKLRYKNAEETFHSNGDLLEAICVNSCCPEQIVVASNRKGLVYLDLNTGKIFSNTVCNLWSQAEWPHEGWAKSESTPMPTYVSPGVGLASKKGTNLGLGGATVGLGGATVGVGTLTNLGKESSFKGAGVGIPGYGGVGALGLGWEEWEDFDGVVDPLATAENINTQAMDSHPLRPLFLVGSRNTHVYLWEFGKSSATATYGILPAANVPPPYALASVSSVRFDHSGHRFATSAIDGTVCTWQLEVGGRSNVCPNESCLCFDRHASDVAFVGGSGGIIAATGASHSDLNLVFWDTLAPSTTSRASIFCHEGGARCLEMLDHDVGGGSISSLIITCGKGGDVALHDFRYIATGKSKRQKYVQKEHGVFYDNHSTRRHQDGELNVNGAMWYISKAHSGSITCVSAVPGTSLFFTGSKDGDIKLWDANKCELVNHWHKVHEKHMFLQHNARGFGAVVQAAVTDIQLVPLGFLSCGGDGSLRLFRHANS